MAPKALGLCLKISGVKMPAANILKQEMLAVGGEAAVHRGVIDGTAGASEVVLIGSAKQVLRVSQKLKDQPFGLKRIAVELEHVCRWHLDPRPLIWRCRQRVFDLSQGPLVMGILNVTPDSFSDGGKFFELRRAVEHGLRMADQGADILDVGGESTRPGAQPISEEEELKRVLPVVEALAAQLKIPISIDTYKSAVARKALEAGASIVNDISGMGFDPDMVRVACRHQAGAVLMHIQGTPRDMQDHPHYEEVVAEVCRSLQEALARAVAGGLEAEAVALDPGIGFGKDLEHNLKLLNNLKTLRLLDRPLVVGVSRKSFIGRLGGGEAPEQRLPGSLAAAVAAYRNGAHIFRVHDVAETKQALAVARAIEEAGW